MSRKEINIFGTSFLDLLSGALAAVIILFVIVPKMSSEQQDALDEIERLDIQVAELEDMMEQLRNSVPQDVYDRIQQQMEVLQSTVDELTADVENLQDRLAQAESENRTLREEVARLREESSNNRELAEENRRLQQRIQELQRVTARSNNSNASGISDGKVFGVNAKLGVVCMWPEMNPDVDLYVKNVSTGVTCGYNNKDTDFGHLMEDVRSRTSSSDDRFELFYQSEIVHGTYEIFVNIYSGQSNWDGRPAHIDGYVVLNPGKHNQKKINYPQIVINRKGVKIRIGTLYVSENDITLR